MKLEPQQVAAIDIGNSRIKILFNDNISVFNNSPEIEHEIFHFIKNQIIKPQATIYSSVNDKMKDIIVDTLSSFYIPALNVQKYLSSNSHIDFSEVKGMGIDRKMGLVGALKYSKPPLITVDFGTAITVNVLDKDFKCRGGLILPGAYIQMKSLINNTALLREVDLLSADEILATNTKDAISNGICYGTVCSIIGILNYIEKKYFRKTKTYKIFTGGGFDLLGANFKKLKYVFNHNPYLILEGILNLINTDKSNRKVKRNQ